MNKSRTILSFATIIMAMTSMAQTRVIVGAMDTRGKFGDDENIILTVDNNVAKITGDSKSYSYAAMKMTENAVMKLDFTTKQDVDMESSDNTITVNVSSGIGYATLYAPYNIVCPAESEATVYTAVFEDSQVKVSDSHKISEGTIIPYGTGLVIKKVDGGKVTFNISSDEPKTGITSDLSGTVVAVPLHHYDPKHVYTLAKNNGKVAFYHYVAPNTTPLKAFFLENESLGQAKQLSFVFEDSNPTNVAAVMNTESNNSATYNTIGQRVSDNAKGIIIKNGKKYVRK